MCACPMTCPAGSRLFITMLNASPSFFSRSSEEISFVNFRSSSPSLFGMSSKVTKCFFGIMSVWPLVRGLESRIARKLFDSPTFCDLVSPCTILQKMQFSFFI